ncbi:hypothetical protein NDU88_003740 [Pleurodeles waltl]|uniref:Uncharacterized protein n=1 Tax=Pleurodeles waltl TaxID=8319 RepID=A0AAV7UE48_PLEWA|nr:hypothetical protein NDU88_003740 [Pleurodeles waltl]
MNALVLRWPGCGAGRGRGPAPRSGCPCGGGCRSKTTALPLTTLGLRCPSAPGGAARRLPTRDSRTLRPLAQPRSTWAASARGKCDGRGLPPIGGLRPTGLFILACGRRVSPRAPVGAGPGRVRT